MRRLSVLEHRFVKSVPRDLESGILYVSVEYSTALHLCACGCGRKVVTPLSPNDWSMTFDGRLVSLNPSIGNWSLPCRSHYFIRRGRIQWAGNWTDKQIKQGRDYDLMRKRGIRPTVIETEAELETKVRKVSLFERVLKWINSKF